jgi:hypothetical protein
LKQENIIISSNRLQPKIILTLKQLASVKQMIEAINLAEVTIYFSPYTQYKNDAVYQDLHRLGLKLKTAEAYEDTSEGIKSIRKADWVIMVISADYLQNEKFMQEVSELLKEKKFKTKWLPIIMPDAEVSDPLQALMKYLSHWQSEYQNLPKIDKLPLNLQGTFTARANLYQTTINFLDTLLKDLGDLKTVAYQDLKDSNYEALLARILTTVPAEKRQTVLSAANTQKAPVESSGRVTSPPPGIGSRG